MDRSPEATGVDTRNEQRNRFVFTSHREFRRFYRLSFRRLGHCEKAETSVKESFCTRTEDLKSLRVFKLPAFSTEYPRVTVTSRLIIIYLMRNYKIVKEKFIVYYLRPSNLPILFVEFVSGMWIFIRLREIRYCEYTRNEYDMQKYKKHSKRSSRLLVLTFNERAFAKLRKNPLFTDYYATGSTIQVNRTKVSNELAKSSLHQKPNEARRASPTMPLFANRNSRKFPNRRRPQIPSYHVIN